MAKIKKLKEEMLVGGESQIDVYPVTTSQAIYSQDSNGNVRTRDNQPEKLEDRLVDHEADAAFLHKEVEKLTLTLNDAYWFTSGSFSQDITNTVKNNQRALELRSDQPYNEVRLTGRAFLETYGDEETKELPMKKLQIPSIKLLYDGTQILETIDPESKTVTQSKEIEREVRSHTIAFEAGYNGDWQTPEGALKRESITFYVNLRKYFGFSDTQPMGVNIEWETNSSGVSHFSNSVSCTVTIPAINSGFVPIYFEVPSGMTITRITQPDSLNAPLAFEYITTINRVVANVTYQYKLYKSTDLIDSANSKRLTIS